jgi:hypothetical protein
VFSSLAIVTSMMKVKRNSETMNTCISPSQATAGLEFGDYDTCISPSQATAGLTCLICIKTVS